MNRPRHTKKDANHQAIVSDLRAAGCVVVDVSDLPGGADSNPLDLFVLSPDRRVWAQVEVKESFDSPFTISELAYLEAIAPGRGQDPFLWRPEIPVLVVTSAADVLAWFR